MKQEQANEIRVRVRNDGSNVGRALRSLEVEGIGVQTWRRFQDGDDSLLLLTTNEPWRARRVLERAGFSCDTDQVAMTTPATLH